MTTPQREIQQIIRQVSVGTGVTVETLLGPSRKEFASNARFILAHRLRKYGLTIEQIGEILGRSNATVLYYLRLYDNMFGNNRMFRDMVSDVEMVATTL